MDDKRLLSLTSGLCCSEHRLCMRKIHAHLLSCQQASMCTCLSYSWGDLAALVPRSTVRMFRRLLRKILQFVCLLCLGTIKLGNWQLAPPCLHAEAATPERWSRVGLGNKCFPTPPHRSGAQIRAAVGSLTCERLAVVGPEERLGILSIAEGLRHEGTAPSPLPRLLPRLLLGKLNPDFGHITQPPNAVTIEEDEVRETGRRGSGRRKGYWTHPPAVNILPEGVPSGAEHWKENRERRAGAGVRKGRKVGVQLGPIRAGPHVPAGGVVADGGGRREQRGQRGGSAESDGPRPCEALLGLSSALLNGAAHTPMQHPPPHPPPPHPPPPSGTARAEQY